MLKLILNELSSDVLFCIHVQGPNAYMRFFCIHVQGPNAHMRFFCIHVQGPNAHMRFFLPSDDV